MAAQPPSGAALAVIKRMFEDPIPRLLPSETSVWQIIEGERYGAYSPHKWADPLLLYKWQLGGKEDIAAVMPATNVQTNTKFDPTYLEHAKGLTVFEELEEKEESLASNLDNALILFNFRDEAAIVRLLLLQIMLSKPTDLIQASSLVQQIAVNMNVKKDEYTGSWSLPPEISNIHQIGTETSSSALYLLAIDELDNISLKDNSLNSLNDDIVFIPVRRSWEGMSWLMAYILSFTTTAWWNHSYTLDVEYSNEVSEATEGLPMKATFMPKAATVCISGVHKEICLVVVDAKRSEFPDDWEFEVCKGISASLTGNLEFAKKAYAYLGRLSDPDVEVISGSDISNALNNMSMFSSAKLRQLHLKASILATSRFNGFGCYPNPEPPKNRKHIIGPVAFNNKDEIVIGDYVLPDLAKMEEEERRTQMHNLNFWRCDPLGFFTYSNTGDLYSQYTPFQYRLSIGTFDVRFVNVDGMFLQNSKVGCHAWGIPSYFFNTTLGYASLMLGLTNWYLVEMGCTLFEHNYLLPDEPISHEPLFQGIWGKITSDFVIDCEYWRNANLFPGNLSKVGRIMNISEQENPEETDWINTHFSGNVPWWFVGDIAAKFGHSFKIKTPVAFFKGEIGWHIKETNDSQYGLSLLTASSKYELKVRRNNGPYFPIHTLNSEGTRLSPNMVSWDMNRVLDKKKLQLGRCFPRGLVDCKGIVELNVIILRKPRYSELGHAFVASDNRILADDQNTWPQVSGLKWFNGDNGYLDWLGGVSGEIHTASPFACFKESKTSKLS